MSYSYMFSILGTSCRIAALHTLRGAVRSTMASKPDFRLRHPSLTTAECDMKKTLGQACDTELILARVEPVRGTKVGPHDRARRRLQAIKAGSGGTGFFEWVVLWFGTERSVSRPGWSRSRGTKVRLRHFETESSCVMAVGKAVHDEPVVVTARLGRPSESVGQAFVVEKMWPRT